MTVPADNRLSPDNQRLIETVRAEMLVGDETDRLLDLIAARLARLEALERAAQHYLDGTDPDGYVNLHALLYNPEPTGMTAPSSWPDTRMSKMREALLYVGSAHDSVKRDALAEIEQWESELEVMAGALEAKIRPDTPDCPRCGSPGASFSTHPCNPPDTPAQEHADTVREVVRRLSGTGDVPAIDFALDALLAEITRLTAERDEARKAMRYYHGRAQAAEALAERRRVGLQAVIDYVPDGFVSPMDDEDSMNYRAIARAALADGGQET